MKRDVSLDQKIAALAARQRGHITRQQLLDLASGDRAIERVRSRFRRAIG
jgi:hypothetical protein